MSVDDLIPWLREGTPGYNLFAEPPKAPPIPEYILPENTLDHGAAPQRGIATRRSEAFVATGCEIRCVDLRDLKARDREAEQGNKEMKRAEDLQDNGKGYQVLDIPDLNFDVQQLEISPDGNYMALVGKTRLAICVLPAPGFARLRSSKLRSAFRLVGKPIHHEGSAKIVRALWHPLGVEGASLVVLTRDTIVRVYDFKLHLTHTFDIPDQEFNLTELSGRGNYRSSFTPDPEAFDPASCCFASGDLGWRPFTLYIAMRGGDIYALCPIVPSRWNASQEFLNNLSVEVATHFESLGDINAASAGDKLATRQQTKWIDDILLQQTELVKQTRKPVYWGPGGKQSNHFTRPQSIPYTPMLQGPFLMQPAPVDLSSEEVYACDIIHVCPDPVAVLAILWSNGNVDIFLEPEPIVAKWQNKRRVRLRGPHDGHEELPVIASYETMVMKAKIPRDHPRHHWPVFVQNPTSCESLFAAHYSGVETIEMSGWLKGLRVVLDQDEGDDFIAKLLQRAQGSQVTKIIDSGNDLPTLPHPITGCSVISDSYLGTIVLARSPRLIHAAAIGPQSQDLSETSDVPGQLNIISGLGPAGFGDLKSSGIAYVPAIPDVYEIPAFLHRRPMIADIMNATKQRNPGLFSGRICLNAETLDILRQARELVTSEYEKLTDVGKALCTAAALQKEEYTRQLLTVGNLIERNDRIKKESQDARLDKIKRRQDDLCRRADEIVRKLVVGGLAVGVGGGVGAGRSDDAESVAAAAAGAVELSEREKEWVEEVAKVEKKLTSVGGAGIILRVSRAEDVMEHIKAVMAETGIGAEETREAEERADDGADSGDVDKEGVPRELREQKNKELMDMLEKQRLLIEALKAKTESLDAKCDEVGV